ncbi:MAG: HEAT repeat domain-containing protein, partial [Acidobacteriota bacterium]
IIQLEDERNLNGGELAKLLRHASPKVRERAALAIGRIGDKRGTAALIELLQSEKDEQVRAMAAFALGEMEDAAAVPALLEFLTPGKYPIAVRARPVEALGKIASVPANVESLGKATIEQISNRLIEQLPNPEFTLTADKRPTANLTITALMRVRSVASVEPLTRQLKSAEADLRAQAANALARIRQPIAAAVPALLEALNDSDHNVRANAARALGVSKDARAVEPLIKLLGDKSEQVQVSAIRALAAIGDKRAVDSLVELLKPSIEKANSQVNQTGQSLSLEVATALGTLGDKKALPTLRTLRQSHLPGLSAEIEIAIAKLDEKRIAELGSRLIELVKSRCQNWKETLVIAQTINALLPMNDFRDWKAATDGLTFVLAACEQRGLPEVMRAVDRLAFHSAHASFLKLNTSSSVSDPPVKDREAEDRDFFLLLFRKKLESKDEVVRATAATIFGERANEKSLDPLIIALKQSAKDTSNDAKLAILTALSKYKSEKAVEAIKTALTDSDHLVRRQAVNLLKQSGAGDFSDRIGIVKTNHDKLFYQRVVARMNKKITATLHTDKGAVTMELFPAEAPITVDSFVTLARKGYFNNLTFHRVVPNFVIQGGDPRGDGEGGPGYQIRCEVNTRPYILGAVGMALSGKDTGGSQFFITHSPQPHLDGGYTVFGQVTSGLDVVDRIARGDTIKRIVIVEK